MTTNEANTIIKNMTAALACLSHEKDAVIAAAHAAGRATLINPDSYYEGGNNWHWEVNYTENEILALASIENRRADAETALAQAEEAKKANARAAYAANRNHINAKRYANEAKMLRAEIAELTARLEEVEAKQTYYESL